MAERIAVIVSSESSIWMSCRIITPNLVKAYQLAFAKNASYFSLTDQMTRGEIWDLAKKIQAYKPSRLVILDHAPHPAALLWALAQCYGEKGIPPLFIHVYGDFTLYTNAWIGVQGLLCATRVHFICASDRQATLVSRFLMQPEKAVSRCPFPVETNIFKYDPKLREQWRMRLREKFQVKPEELVILYTGRMSLQKNIPRLIGEVIRFSKVSKIPLKFFMAGPFDDLGAPFFGVTLNHGFYRQYLMQAIQQIEPGFLHNIHYLGNFDAEGLKGLYNAADAYVSLSLHHDEDYGMSPAEALCCGTPVVLSDWGGYASFASENTSSVQLVNVEIQKEGLYISSEDFLRGMLVHSIERSGDQLDPEEVADERKARSEFYSKALSVEAVAETIKEIHEKKPPVFAGFNWRMQKFSEHFSQKIPFPEGPKYNSFYEEIYAAYTNARP